MDRNSIIGLLLIGAILVGYGIWNQPSQAEIDAAARRQDSIAQVQSLEAERAREAAEEEEAQAVITESDVPVDSAEQARRDSVVQLQKSHHYGVFTPQTTGEEQFHVLENDFIRVTLTNKGAAPVSAELKGYKCFNDSLPLYLFDRETSSFRYTFWLEKEIRSNELYFELVEEATNELQVSYRLYGESRDQYMEFTYSIAPGESYLMEANVHTMGLDRLLRDNDNRMGLEWDIAAPFHERSLEQEQRVTTVYYKVKDGDVDYLSETGYEEESLDAADLSWMSFKQQFFSAAVMADQGFSRTDARAATEEFDNPMYTKKMSMAMSLEFPGESDPDFAYRFYFGPNHVQTLETVGVGLEEQINLGWAIFGWVNRWLVIPVFNFLDENTNLSYGIIILILTILIKLILFPLNWKNYLSSARMRVLKPEVDEINEKMKDKDAMAKQQAVMSLYRQAGVNPMAGCVPMLLQMPILWAMFRFFPASIELRQEPFLWARDLSTYDAIVSWSTHIPLLSDWYGNHVSLFTLLMAISTFFYSKYNMDLSTGSSAQMPQMKMMVYLMPFMLLFIFNDYSAGLSYYYFAANVLSMVQQFVIKKFFINEEQIHRKIQENKKKPAKKSNFQQRLENMARERGIQPPKR